MNKAASVGGGPLSHVVVTNMTFSSSLGQVTSLSSVVAVNRI